MPTGGGKSLCMFLLPLAINTEAMGVIVGPLIGLIEQQVTQLASVGVAAVHGYNSTHVDDIKAGKFRFVFISPETAQLPEWKTMLTELRRKIALVAIDEAHCISEWGTDFRKAFKEVGGLRALIGAPFMALTASAPPSVQEEIVSSLFLRAPVVVSCNLNRRNVFVSASPIKSLDRDLCGISSMLKSSSSFIIPKMIVYVQTKNAAWRVFSFLQKECARRCYVAVYHASLTQATKSKVYEDFRSCGSSLRCLVATVAFGMGMDIPDVEVVVVYGAPKSMSQLYQLFGRAGMPSRSHLFYSKKTVTDEGLKSFVADKCRRHSLLQTIGGCVEDASDHPYGCCDVCDVGRVSVRLDIVFGGVNRRKERRVAKRTVSLDLEEKLLVIREEVLKDHPSFLMIGSNFFCPDSTIKKLCEDAKYVTSANNFSVYVRPELKDKFFSAIFDTS